jgi:hypothetical protein
MTNLPFSSQVHSLGLTKSLNRRVDDDDNVDEGSRIRAGFLTELIRKIRGAYGNLPRSLRASPHCAGLVQRPTQILALSIPSLKISKLWVLHLKKASDLTVWAYGPLTPYEALQVLESARNDAVLQEEVPEDSAVRAPSPSPPTVSAAMERSMLEFLELLQSRTLAPPVGGGLMSSNYAPVYQEITLYGDYLESTPDGLLGDWVDQAMEFQPVTEQALGRKRKPTLLEAYSEIQARDRGRDWSGVFYYPPIRVGPKPDNSLIDQLAQRSNKFEPGPIELVGKVGPIPAFVTHYGLFGVQTRDPEVACRLLNLVFGFLHLDGLPSFAVRPSELGTFRLDPDAKSFLEAAIPGTYSSVGNKDWALSRFTQPTAVEVERVKRAFSKAEEYSKDDTLPRYFRLLMDSYGSLFNKEWDYAFYSAWMVIEMEVVAAWEELVVSGSVSQAKYESVKAANTSDPEVRQLPKKMAKVGDYVYYMITALKLFGKLDQLDHDTYEELRKRRNKILHPDTPATERDARDCYDAAKKIAETKAKAVSD